MKSEQRIVKNNLNTISFEISDDGVGHMVMNQPPANQMTMEFFSEFTLFVEELKEMKSLKALVISGRGRHFSSGADLDGLLKLAGSGSTVDYFSNNYRSFLFLEEMEIPVIAAIRGVCIGSAFELALFSHFRFSGEDAVFGLPETTYNLIPGIGGISRMVKLCGQARAIELALKGNTFPAEEALGYHLIDRIVPKRKVAEHAFAFARSIMMDYHSQKSSLYLKKTETHESAVS